MANFGIMRNSQGYADPTAGKALLSLLPKSGQIWHDRRGREMLIIKHHSEYSTALLLTDRSYLPLEVNGRRTDAGMLRYLYDNDAADKVEDISAEDFTNVVLAINEKLSTDIEVNVCEKAYDGAKFAHLESIAKSNAERAAKAQADAEHWQSMYNQIIDKVIARLVG